MKEVFVHGNGADPTWRELAFEYSNVGISLIDSAGIYIEANRCFCEIIGRDKEEIIGKTPGDFNHPDENVKELEGFRSLIEGEIDSYISEKRYLLKNGNPTWVRMSAKSVRNADGSVRFLIASVEDINLQKKMESELVESRLQFRQVLDAIQDLVLVKGPHSKILWANRAFRDYYGMSNEELAGIVDAPFSEPDHTQEYIRHDSYVFNSGRSLDIFLEPVNRHDGVVRLFHTVKSPIFDERGNVIMTVGVSRDITERKESEKLLDHQRARLIATSKMSALGEMAGGIAHEINNPLAIILGNANLLKAGLAEQSLNHKVMWDGLEKIETTANRIAKIVKGLRAFSRSAENDPPSEVQARQVIDDTLELCSERFKSFNITLRVEEIPEAKLECRPAQISQILLNLLNNAYDAVLRQASPWISLSVNAEGERVQFIVTDSGNGISREVSSRMMEPFFTTKDINQGTGLGLSIAKGIAEDHGGTLAYDQSYPNTRFILELPIRQAKRTL